MTITNSQHWRRLPTDTGAADIAQKGQPVSSSIIRETVRNTNYAAQHRIPGVLIGGCGHTDDYGEGVAGAQYASNRVWSLTGLGPRGHSLVWDPHATALTVGYAIRAEGIAGLGVIDIYLCDQAWTAAAPPVASKSTKASVAITGGSYSTGGVGTVNGEYKGSIAADFPAPPDRIYHIYFDMTQILVIGSWCVWVEGVAP